MATLAIARKGAAGLPSVLAIEGKHLYLLVQDEVSDQRFPVKAEPTDENHLGLDERRCADTHLNGVGDVAREPCVTVLAQQDPDNRGRVEDQ